MYHVETYVDGRWARLGGSFHTRQEAAEKIAQYMQCGVKARTPAYRIVPSR
jgi:hypothetical protein